MSNGPNQQSRRKTFPEKDPKIWWVPKVGRHDRDISHCPYLPSLTSFLHKHPLVLDEIIMRLNKKKIEYLMQIQEARSTTLKSAAGEMNIASNLHKRYRPESPVEVSKVARKNPVSEKKNMSNDKLFANVVLTLASALRADWHALYVPSNNLKYLNEYGVEGNKCHSAIIKGTTVSAEAACTGKTLMVENLAQNNRFPKGVAHPERNVKSVLSLPIVFPSGDLHGVIELCRDENKESFDQHDLVISNWLVGWMVCTLHQQYIGNVLNLQAELNDFLWEVSTEGHYSIDCIDKLVQRLLFFSKNVVKADRFTMILVSHEKGQLYADSFSSDLTQNEMGSFTTKKEMRFGCDKGIAGYVFATNETVNIPDAYQDYRFDPDVDEIDGYCTKSMLCMPISNKTSVIGVIQMVNSLSHDYFTHADEYTFKMYAIYCAVALHVSKVYKEYHLQRLRLQTIMEVMENYIVAPAEESTTLSPDTPPEMIPLSFFLFDFCAYDFEERLPQLFIYMLHNMFGKYMFNFTKLSRFVITVRKNYRDLAYHNWKHGFQVAHSLYTMMKKNSRFWRNKEAMAMLIAGLCHDIDHRGYNNTFYKEFKHPFSQLYGTSVMERHHYKQTISILKLKDHDIFSFLNTKQYKEMLLLIEESIIATDPSYFYKNQEDISRMLKDKTFNIRNEHCRKRYKGLMMTCADLCGIAKPWRTQIAMVVGLYNEFYVQGDIEKKHGLHPIELMDRNMRYSIPKQQVGFLRAVCKPIYYTLVDVLPGCKPLLEGVLTNLKHWEKVMDVKEEHVEEEIQSENVD